MFPTFFTLLHLLHFIFERLFTFVPNICPSASCYDTVKATICLTLLLATLYFVHFFKIFLHFLILFHLFKGFLATSLGTQHLSERQCYDTVKAAICSLAKFQQTLLIRNKVSPQSDPTTATAVTSCRWQKLSDMKTHV